MKIIIDPRNCNGKRTIRSHPRSSFCYYRHADGTRGVNFQVLTPMSKISYNLEETLPGIVTVTTKSADRQLLKKNGFVSMVNKTVYEQDYFFLTVYKVLKQIRALQREFGADTVKISTVFYWTEL